MYNMRIESIYFCFSLKS